jgi:hypothetical protein
LIERLGRRDVIGAREINQVYDIVRRFSRLDPATLMYTMARRLLRSGRN